MYSAAAVPSFFAEPVAVFSMASPGQIQKSVEEKKRTTERANALDNMFVVRVAAAASRVLRTFAPFSSSPLHLQPYIYAMQGRESMAYEMG